MVAEVLAFSAVAGIAAIIGKYFRGHSAAAIFTGLFIILPVIILPGHAGWLLGTIPLAIVVYPVMCVVYHLADRQRS